MSSIIPEEQFVLSNDLVMDEFHEMNVGFTPSTVVFNNPLIANNMTMISSGYGSGRTSTTLSNGSTITRHSLNEIPSKLPPDYASLGGTTSVNVSSIESWIRENLSVSIKLRQTGNDLEVEVSLDGPNDSLISRDFDRISLDELRT